MEKIGSTSSSDVRDLIKQADALDRTIVLNMDEYMGKRAVIVMAVGEQAEFLTQLIDASNELDKKG